MIIKGFIIILAIAISVRDACHYKISNVLLLMMIAVKSADLIVYMISNGWNAWGILSSLAGAFTGFIIFFSASMTKYELGAGDIKYSTVVGFLLGFNDYLWAMLIGCAAGIIYSVATRNIWRNYLKKGVPLAPFISFGLIVMLFIG